MTSEDLLMTWFTYSDGFIANLEREQSHDVAAAAATSTACCDVSAYPGSLEIALIILYPFLKDYYVVYFSLSSLSLLLYNTYMVAGGGGGGGGNLLWRLTVAGNLMCRKFCVKSCSVGWITLQFFFFFST